MSADTWRRRNRHDEAVISSEVRQLARVIGALRPVPGASLARSDRVASAIRKGPIEATRSALKLGQPGEQRDRTIEGLALLL